MSSVAGGTRCDRRFQERSAHRLEPFEQDACVDAELTPGSCGAVSHVQDVPSLEVGVYADAVVAAEQPGVVGAEHGLDLLGRPDVEPAFDAFAVGVL